MKYAIMAGAFAGMLVVQPAFGQQPENKSGSAPIYRITVVQRTTKAVNYEYRSAPTRIDFRGTVLLAHAKGSAMVESKQGRTDINAHFENVKEPSRFGREYLTYVLWALTPDGRPHNLGEVIANGSDRANLHVTTNLQAFALIVTAEPYSAVRQPSDVVVLENEIRPDTVGKIEEVNARYELLPRGHYSWQVPTNLNAAENGPKVSMRKYEELLELYQAQNAVGIARAANAEQYAPNTFAKAQQLLTDAQRMEQSKGDTAHIIQNAREAAQTAEDARIIAERHEREDRVATAQQARSQAEAEVQRDSAQAQIETDRLARERSEAEAAAARERAAQAQSEAAPAETMPQAPREPDQNAASKAAARMRLLEQCNGILSTRDTPRGLVATIPDAEFSGAALRGTAIDRIARITAIIVATPGLRVQVDGHTDTAGTEPLSRQRAEAARQVLLQHGLPAGSVTARGWGNTRPLASNATETGRVENQRVEIVISGDAIGALPFWDHPYSLKGQ